MPVRGSRVFVIGLDGGTWKLLEPFADQGLMPHLARLMQVGAWGILKSTIPPITPVAWSSFQTGVNPGKHGVFGWSNVKENRRHIDTTMNADSIRVETIWELASKGGKTIVSINVPMTYPPRSVNGAIVAGILSPSTKAPFVFPSELKDEFLKEVEEYDILNDFIFRYSPHADTATFVDAMIKSVKTRVRAGKYLMKKYTNWDLFMLHLHAVDVIQHPLWCYLDTNHPLYNREKHLEVKRFYRVIDDIIGEFSRTLKENDILILVSDHGFHAHHKTIRLNNWLYQQGFLMPNQRGNASNTVSKVIQKLKYLDKWNIRTRILPNYLRRRLFNFGQDTTFDWESTEAYGRADRSYGIIYFQGCQSQSSSNSLAKKIIEAAITLQDPDTGDQLVEDCYLGEEIYTGSILKPDLVLKPADGYSFTSSFNSHSPILETVDVEKDFHIGKHHEDGIILFSGKIVNATNNKPFIANIVDVTPTLLYLLNLPIPKYMDGTVITQALSGMALTFQPIVRQATTSSNSVVKATSGSSPADEQQIIRERLRNLGYLD